MNFKVFAAVLVISLSSSFGHTKTCEESFISFGDKKSITLKEFTTEIIYLCFSAKALYNNNGQFKFRTDVHDYHGTASRRRFESYRNFMDKVDALEEINDEIREGASPYRYERETKLLLSRAIDAIIEVNYASMALLNSSLVSLS